MSNPEVHVAVFDTTARDGAQSLPSNHQFPAGSKVDIATEIAGFGVDVIEAGFPRTPFDGEEVTAVAQTVGTQATEVRQWVNGTEVDNVARPPVIAGLSRIAFEDIEATWEAVQAADFPRIHTFVSTSDFHRRAKFPGVSRQQLLENGQKAIVYARDISAGHPNATVEFSAEAASTTDTVYLERVVKMAVSEGVDVINVPDTVGERDPLWMYNFYRSVLRWATQENPAITVSAHNHNDLSNAVANTHMLVRAAADHALDHDSQINIQLETTVCGLGERAGNADVFPVVAGLFKFTPDNTAEVRWRINPQRAVRVANAVMAQAGLEVDRQDPVVGRDILRHRSGIHSDGVVKGGHEMYSPFDPQFWGHGASAIHEEGKYQGKAGTIAAHRSV